MLGTVIFSTLDKTANRYIVLNNALFVFSTAESNGYLTRVYQIAEILKCVNVFYGILIT